MEQVLLKGSEAIAEGAVLAGCRFFFGYPITPQNEIPEYFARRLPQVNGTFLQAESEIAAINMVYGAGGTGARVMTSSSSPGMSLKQEGISYLSCAEVPCVIVSIMRGGPGLGAIQGAQPDYFQAVKGGGHGDYKNIVLAPSTVQEAADLTYQAFDLADKYRNPVIILGDGILAQMMEPIVLPNEKQDFPEKNWALNLDKNRPRNVISSSYPIVEELEKVIIRLNQKAEIMKGEVRWDTLQVEDADYIIVAYGTSARIAKAVVRQAREIGIKLGLLRPITLWPFPYDAIYSLVPQVKAFFALEMSTGQMIEDVKIAIGRERPVYHIGRYGGVIPRVNETLEKITAVAKG
ncbi:MAG: 3-methyl-2-oxobutanoate dehydrogenase subunit VorB [Tepidanaerobacteraceae bacterium]|nr:3-methyl-2-oxobutanoate dehydrogenase subunit VorB [Tepidanaerobacteraceae bacterium]